MNIPNTCYGEVADICFDYLLSTEEPIAIKVFSMVVFEKIVFAEPELKTELQFLIEEQLSYALAGFKSR